MADETAPTAVEPSPTDEAEWAVESDLPQNPWQDIVLPVKGKKVRVRYLAAWELTRLQLLPDLTRFGELMAKAHLMSQKRAASNGKPGRKKKEDEIDASEVASENYRYLAEIAHLAVIDPMKMGVQEDCRHCGFRHPVSLWKADRTGLLLPPDLDEIAGTALGTQVMADVIPFSTEETPNDSPVLVASGE